MKAILVGIGYSWERITWIEWSRIFQSKERRGVVLRK